MTGGGSRPETGSGSTDDSVVRTGSAALLAVGVWVWLGVWAWVGVWVGVWVDSRSVGSGLEVLNRSEYASVASIYTLVFKLSVVFSEGLATVNEKYK